MPVFAYRALDATGRDQRGVVDADSVRAAWQALRARGVYPTDLAEAGAARAAARGRVRATDLAAATRQLATLVAAGVPAGEALDAALEEAATPALAHAFTVTRDRVRAGEPLATALAASPDVFPPLYRDLVRAGEASGALGTVLDRLASHTEAVAATRARLRAALTYPVVTTTATAGVLAFLLLWVVPQVAALFADTGAPLPLATRVLLGAVTALRMTWWLLALGALAATLGLRRWRATPAGRLALDGALLRLPVVGALARTAAVARLTRTLAVLLESGVPVEGALGIAADTAGNAVLAAATRAARDRVRQGQPLAAALRATGAFPPVVVRLAATGERGGNLAAGLERAGVEHERAVEAGIATLTGLVEPVLVLATGAVVLVLVVAILVPIMTFDPLRAH